jgi:ABC-type hemin transport system ATPase subunit
MKTIDNNSNLFSDNIFEERAENLSKQELMAWSVETTQDRSIIKKLQSTGTKLLSGPRGSGKSTLLRKAYFGLLDSGKVLPAYVNYSQSLALEPLFHNHANALQIFRQWVLFKIVVGIGDAFDDAKKTMPEGLEKYVRLATDFIGQLEQSYEPNLENNTLSLSILKTLIDGWAFGNGFQRSILLLDDAAHAFSALQQREFFEIFRSLKSRTISPKAAVYPGITSYSPNFHIGHDAKLIEAWYKPEEENYLDTMKELLQKRLSSDKMALLNEKKELLEYLALAAFGLPRSFLTMISQLLGIEEESPNKPSRKLAREAILRNCFFLRCLFQSLSKRLPRYSNLVEMGHKLEVAIIREECDLDLMYTFERQCKSNQSRSKRLSCQLPLLVLGKSQSPCKSQLKLEIPC